MRYLGILILFVCLSSCQYYDKEKVNAEDLLNEELQTFNWNAIDQYPSFSQCDSSSTKQERKLCFETTLNSHIISRLENELIIVSETVNDTLIMEFQISEKGELKVKHVESSPFIKSQIPDIDSLLTASVKDLPTIFPAIKRGQQVKTEFKLPIIIKN